MMEGKHFSKMVCNEKGEEARLHIYRDENGVHITLDFQTISAYEALDEALSSRAMGEEKFHELIDFVNKIYEGD